jgi:asparagine synthase (glutamine-hydrolysing)
MCGINGIFAYHPASNLPNAGELLKTREAMRARGPDGSGTWWSSSRRCGLAHRRLAILDLSDRAAQPMTSEDGSVSVVFNGEIYNYPELRVELEAAGSGFRTNSDTEVLLHLYSRLGSKLVQRLRGMFAFAIWDEAHSGLLLGRDAYGIKPLYTANDGWTFRFASQVKALVAGNQVSRDPEPAGIVGFHLFGSVPEPFTLYREVRALPAGHTQWIDNDGAREPKPFASISQQLAEGSCPSRTPGEIQGVLRAAVAASVKAHLLADVEVGMFLSAGIDSGALLGAMRDAEPRNIRAITLGYEEFGGTSQDEVPLAALVARLYGTEHIVRQVKKIEFFNDLSAIVDAMDQPSIDGVNTWFVSKAAKEAGIKVALSGLGGDELLGGYPSFVDLPRWRSWFGALSVLPGLGRSTRHILEALAPVFSKVHPKALGLLEYSRSWAGAYLVRRGLFLPHELPRIIDPEIAIEGLRRLSPLERLADCLRPDPVSDAGRVCALESANYMRNQLLRDTDWAAMAHGIEVRVPLVDFEVLKALAPAIPHIRPGKGKAALAQVPSIPLPADNVARAKTGFGVPTGAWMRSAAATGDLCSAIRHEHKGLVSRAWSREVLRNWISPSMLREVQAT